MKKLFLSLLLIVTLCGCSQAQCITNGGVNTIPACDTACNGIIIIEFVLASLPVNVFVNGVPHVATVNLYQLGGLCAGVYNIIAVDSNGDTCSIVNPTVTIQSTNIAANLQVNNVSCPGCNDGAIWAYPTGGAIPYTYLWSDGSNLSFSHSLTMGTYCVTITDNNGCSKISCATVGYNTSGLNALSGQIYLDANSNGVKDIGEMPLFNQEVNIQPAGTTSLSFNNGTYLAIVDSGTHDVSFVSKPGWSLTSSPATYNVTVSGNSITGLDFGVYADSTSAGAAISFTSMFVRCFASVGYMAHVINTGFTSLNGTVEVTYDPALTFVNSTPVAISHIGNVLSYSFTNLPPGSIGNFNMTFIAPAGGTQLLSTVSMGASDSFGNQITQSTTLSQTVNCANDPNDKQVTPAGIGALNYVAMDEWLTYLIRFQNTGNDTAFKVVILDTLDLNLDVNSFTVIGSSHTMYTNISPSREVSFTFENILLPDSNVNEPGSHGYVLYRIKGNATNTDPSTVENTAHIIFDFNSAIVTNTTLTTFSDNFLSLFETGSENEHFSIFPNPMNSGSTLKYSGPNDGDFEVEILDITGKQVIVSNQMKNGSLFIPKNGLNAGTYIIKVHTPTPSYLRLVVQ